MCTVYTVNYVLGVFAFAWFGTLYITLASARV